MKKFNVCLLVLVGTINLFGQNAEADFTTKNNADGSVTIVKYIGWDLNIVIPATIGGKPVTAIDNRAFAASDATSVTVGNNVITIGSEAFASGKMQNVTIGGSVTTIGERAFAGNQLAKVTIGNNVTTIAKGAFANSQITSLTLGNGITGIGEGAFTIGKQAKVILAENNNFDFRVNLGDAIFFNYITNNRKAGEYNSSMKNEVKNSFDGFSYIETQYGLIITSGQNQEAVRIPDALYGLPVKAIYGRSERYDISNYGPEERDQRGAFQARGIARVLIPSGITYIGANAFAGKANYTNRSYENSSNNSLTNIEIPNSVTYIGNGAFHSNQFTNISIPNSVSYIGNNAFGSNRLTNIVIPNSVTYIGNGAFYSNQLTNIMIPNNVSYIGDYAFSENQLINLTINGNGNTHIGNGAFQRNRLTSVVIGNGVKTIGNLAFAGSIEVSFSPVSHASANYASERTIRNPGSGGNQLTSVSIGSGVTHIGEFAFAVNKLTSVTIGEGVKTIGAFAFLYNQLTSVTIGSNVTHIGEFSFSSWDTKYSSSSRYEYIINGIRTLWYSVGSYSNENKLTSIIIPNSVIHIGAYAFAGNQLTSVTIGANVTIDDTAALGGLKTVYNGKAGRYVLNGNTWSLVAQ